MDGADFEEGAKSGAGEQQAPGRATTLAMAEREKGLCVCVCVKCPIARALGFLKRCGPTEISVRSLHFFRYFF